MVTLKTFGGLANRMRAIDSTFQLTHEKNLPLQVIWEMSFELNCSFFKLFMPVKEFEVSEFYVPKYVKKIKNRIDKSLLKVNIKLPIGYKRYLFDKEVEVAKQNKIVRELFNDSVKTYISTVHQFYQVTDSFAYFKPVHELDDKINQLRNSFSSNTIGIHIRRSDNALSIQHSPIKAFVDAMQREIDADSNTMFFLATDSTGEEQYLKRTFPDRILSYDKQLDRNSEKGIQDALVDLYSLSNTKKIIGSYYSSFSEVAAQIKGIALNLIVENK